MSDVSEDTKRQIQSLATEQLAYEIHIGRKSRYQREKFDYLKTVYDLRLAQQEDEHRQNALEVAKEANSIAGQALATSQKSYRLAIGVGVVSLAALAVQYFSK